MRAFCEGAVSLLAVLLDDLLSKFEPGALFTNTNGQEDVGTAARWGYGVYFTDQSHTSEANSRKKCDERPTSSQWGKRMGGRGGPNEKKVNREQGRKQSENDGEEETRWVMLSMWHSAADEGSSYMLSALAMTRCQSARCQVLRTLKGQSWKANACQCEDEVSSTHEQTDWDISSFNSSAIDPPFFLPMPASLRSTESQTVWLLYPVRRSRKTDTRQPAWCRRLTVIAEKEISFRDFPEFLFSVQYCQYSVPWELNVMPDCWALLLFEENLCAVDAFWEPAVHTEHLKKYDWNSVGDPQTPTRSVRWRGSGGRSDSNIEPSKS